MSDEVDVTSSGLSYNYYARPLVRSLTLIKYDREIHNLFVADQRFV